jgi:hypothetical protein
MNMKVAAVAAALGLSFAGTAIANDASPIEDQAIDLGDIAGDAYYTVQPDGYHVTATFADRRGTTTPVRFEAVLASGQALRVSTPRGAGEQPISVSIRREDARVIVSKTPEIN